jgi:hypothetical protein
VPCGRDANGLAPALGFNADEALLAGIFPNRKPWTGSTPCVHGFGVGSLPSRQPLQEIEDQSFGGFAHNDDFTGEPAYPSTVPVSL